MIGIDRGFVASPMWQLPNFVVIRRRLLVPLAARALARRAAAGLRILLRELRDDPQRG